jgi:molybdenum cofactor cytidylyltransferase
MTIAALLLAAGESTRMGRLKQLVPWDGRPLVAWQAEQLREGGASEVVVVLGHRAEEIRAAVPSWCRVVVNEAYKDGRATSLRAGAEALLTKLWGSESASQIDVEALLIINVDQPRPAWLSRRLVERWRSAPAPIISPKFPRRFGHPVLLDGALLPELREVNEATQGLRAVVQRHASEAVAVPVDNEALDYDMNTPGDYEAALAAFELGEWDESPAT